MTTITPGKYVALAYDLSTVSPDGKRTLVHTVEAKEPESFIYGVTPGILEGLARAIDGKKQGDTFEADVPAAEGFPYNPADIVKLPIDIFLDGEGQFDTERIKVDEPLPMLTADGRQITGVVKAIDAENVTMDFNHPLTGKDLHFAGTIVDVHDATPDELRPYLEGCGGGCGGCCGGGNCGDSSDGGCCGGCGE